MLIIWQGTYADDTHSDPLNIFLIQCKISIQVMLMWRKNKIPTGLKMRDM